MSQNLWFSDISREYRNGTSAWNGLAKTDTDTDSDIDINIPIIPSQRVSETSRSL